MQKNSKNGIKHKGKNHGDLGKDNTNNKINIINYQKKGNVEGD